MYKIDHPVPCVAIEGGAGRTWGMCVETIGKIRRRRLIEREPISEIARDLQLSRKTVKRALKFEGEAFEYRRARQPKPKLGAYLATLESWLEAPKRICWPANGATVVRGIARGRLCRLGGQRTPSHEAFEQRRQSVAPAFIPQSGRSRQSAQRRKARRACRTPDRASAASGCHYAG